MDKGKRKPDDFNMTTLFGIMAALVIVVMSASAAGQQFFRSDTRQDAEASKDGLSGFGISSILPIAAYKNLTEDLTQELDDVTAAVDGQPEESREDDSVKDSEKDWGDPSQTEEGVFNGLMADIVPAARTRRLVATAETAQDTVTGAKDLKEDVEKVTETISKKKAIVLAIYSVWKTAFSNTWSFLKKISSTVWNVFKEGSQYSPPDTTEVPVPSPS